MNGKRIKRKKNKKEKEKSEGEQFVQDIMTDSGKKIATATLTGAGLYAIANGICEGMNVNENARYGVLTKGFNDTIKIIEGAGGKKIMKKTMQSIMTAAAFAAAMGSVTAGTVNAIGNASTIPTSEIEFDPSAQKFSPLYGPPEVLLPKGDVNMDANVDIFDLIIMKRSILSGEELGYSSLKLADVNGDGEFNIADVVSMQHFLNGSETYYVKYSDEELGLTTTTTISDIENCIQTSYGPPVTQITTQSDIETIITTFTTTVQAVYGPPDVMSSLYAEMYGNITTETQAQNNDDLD